MRYLYNADGVFVDAERVRQGWVQPVEYPPDTLHAAEFRRLAQEAAEAGAGFWAGSSAYDGAMSYGFATGAINVRKMGMYIVVGAQTFPGSCNASCPVKMFWLW